MGQAAFGGALDLLSGVCLIRPGACRAVLVCGRQRLSAPYRFHPCQST